MPDLPCGKSNATCPLWISIRDYVDKQHEASDKAIELARQAIEFRFEKVLVDQMRQFPDREAHEKLERRLGKLEESTALTTGKVATAITITVAAVTIGIGALLSLLHIFQGGAK